MDPQQVDSIDIQRLVNWHVLDDVDGLMLA
jgi:hypothetical protein